MKMWDGRFSKALDENINSFNSSISFDFRMYKQDIQGSLAHAEMLASCDIISDEDYLKIKQGLLGILSDIENDRLSASADSEDVHMFVEAELTHRIGDAGKRLHTARSRNDQVATDLRLYLAEETTIIQDLLQDLIVAVCDKSEENINTIMPGYTHLQRAQPITFAHHIMAYAQMFLRDLERLAGCKKRTLAACPLGSGALAGTSYPIDRFQTALSLGFEGAAINSIDAVSDRDFCIELASCISLIMAHLSRFSEEIILWSSWEFKFIELDDSFSTGSSIMPQKKNPDIAELVRGKTGRVYGSLNTLLVMIKGTPLAYNKDMQEDKEAIFDAIDTVKACLSAFTPMLSSLSVLKENMRKAAAKGFINATDCADYLVKKGLPFRDAYKITGQLVAHCIEHGETFETLSFEAYKQKSQLFEQDIYDTVNLESCVNQRTSFGGTSPASVQMQIIKTRESILK